MKIAKNCTKMAILEANFIIDLIRSNLNPDFGFYKVEIFTGFEAGFESPQIRTLSLPITQCFQNNDVCKKLELKILKFDRMVDIFVISLSFKLVLSFLK